MSRAKKPKPPHSPHPTVLVCLALAAVVATVYLPVVDHEFIALDDPSFITGNTHVRSGLSWDGVRWALYNDHWSWHPLTWLSHQLDVELFDLDPTGHHVENVALHLANGVLLFLVLNSITGSFWKSAAVAALFSLHPLRVEAVAWAADRKGLLSTLFGLLTIGAYARYSRAPSLSRYGLVAILFAACLMSKAMLVTLPFLLLLCDYWPLRRTGVSAGRLIGEKIPLLAMSTAAALLAARADPEPVALMLRLANAIVAYGRYLAKMIWPFNLALPYPYPDSWPWPQVLMSLLLLVVVSVYALRIRRERPWIAVGWFWYLGALVPAIGLIQSGVQSMADRFSYVPMIGLLVAVVWTVGDRVHDRRPLRFVAVAVLAVTLIAWSIRSSDQLGRWENTTELFRHSVRVTRDNFRAHSILGAHYLLTGNVDAAETHVLEALRIAPDEPEVQLGAGNLMLVRGDYDRALPHFRQAVALDPGDPDSRVALGLCLRQTGQHLAADGEYRAAIELAPDHIAANFHLGVYAMERGDHATAAAHFDVVLKVDPKHADALALTKRVSPNRP